MSKQRLQRFKSITTFGGYATTACGIVLSYATGGSLPALGLSVFGLLLTCCGHWISHKIAGHQAAEREADENRFEDLEFSLRKSVEDRDRLFYAYEAQTKRTEKLESDMKQKVDELRRMTYNAP